MSEGSVLPRPQVEPKRSLRRWSDALQRDIEIPASALWVMAGLVHEADTAIDKDAITPELEAWLYRTREVIIEVVGANSWDEVVATLQIPVRGPRSLVAWLESGEVPADLRDRLKNSLEERDI